MAQKQNDPRRCFEKFHSLLRLRAGIAGCGLLDSGHQIFADAIPTVGQYGVGREHEGENAAGHNSGHHAEAGSHPGGDACGRHAAAVKDHGQAAADQQLPIRGRQKE